MPAWITSELRELVPVPIASAASTTRTSRPAMLSSRATARPTTPAPRTTQSISAAMMFPALLRYVYRCLVVRQRFGRGCEVEITGMIYQGLTEIAVTAFHLADKDQMVA